MIILKKCKGITLVSLVVTVIVMLILVGVTINLTIGNNGIFFKSQEAVEIYKITASKEKIELAVTTYQMNKKNTTLLDELKKIEGISFIDMQADNCLPYTIIIDNYEFIIEEDLSIIYQDKKAPSTLVQPEINLSYETGEVDILNLTISAITKDSLGLKEVIISYKKSEGGIFKYEDISLQSLNGKEATINVEIPINGEYVVQIIGNNGTIAKKEFSITNIKEGSILASIYTGEVNQNEVLLTIKGKTEGVPIEKMELYVSGKLVKTYQYEDNELEKEETFTLNHMEFYEELECYVIVTNCKQNTASSTSKVVKNLDTIESQKDLINLATLVNSGNTFSGRTIYLISDIGTPHNWEPIGYHDGVSFFTGKPFSGTFEGNSHTITISSLSKSNLYKSSGLFGLVVNGTIKNLTINGNLDAECDNVGAIAGGILNSIIKNCRNTGTIFNTSYNIHGGIVGIANESTIQDCTNTGLVYGNSCVGGICGKCETNSKILNCTNSSLLIKCYGISPMSWSSEANGSFGLVGGICGYLHNCNSNYGIINCTNTGTIKGNEDTIFPSGITAGGIVGWSKNSSISKSRNMDGTVSYCASGTAHTSGGLGGIAGALTNNSFVNQCFNTGIISSKSGNNYSMDNSGGIIGYMSDSTLKNTYNTGVIYGNSCVGGIVGTIDSLDANSYLYNSFNIESNISGNSNVGNVIGYSRQVTGSYIFWLTGTNPIGEDNGSNWSNSAQYTLTQMKQTNSEFFTLLTKENGNGVWEQISSSNNGLPYLKYTPYK